MRACGAAELGIVAASWGIELISGSGVLLGGEIAKGVIRTRDFSWKTQQMLVMNKTYQICSVMPQL